MSEQTDGAERHAESAEDAEDAEQIARDYVDLWNQQAYERIPDLISESFVHVDPDGEEFRGREGLEGFMRAVETGFSDFHVDVRELLTDGSVVMYRADVRMTHDGEFQGVPATGERLEFEEMAIVRVADGLVTEHRVYYDKGGVQARLVPTEA